ncbi:MAG: MBL fold metallo-hydrolase [Alkalicoccus sp.]|nr:MAG: MBL fold metallo-hydrolase [Alkalicoccus sp.]
MNVTFLGGAGEYGRSCFLLNVKETSILIDCGVVKGETDPSRRFPQLERVDKHRLAAVFLTHSHEDHTGALERLADLGWSGPVYATGPSFEQTEKIPAAMEKRPLAAGEIKRWQEAGEVKFSFGRSGHTEGACWYLFHHEGETIYFSGDYTLHSSLYPFDFPPEGAVDFAVMDGAGGAEKRSRKETEEAFLTRMKNVTEKGAVHGPLAGKTQELLLLLAEEGLNPAVDPAVYDYTLESLEKRRSWYKNDGAEKLQMWMKRKAAASVSEWLREEKQVGIYEERTLAEAMPFDAAIFTTGPKLPVFEKTSYEKVPFFVHPTLPETKQLLQLIKPKRTVFTHTSVPEVFQDLKETEVISVKTGDTVDMQRIIK